MWVSEMVSQPTIVDVDISGTDMVAAVQGGKIYARLHNSESWIIINNNDKNWTSVAISEGFIIATVGGSTGTVYITFTPENISGYESFAWVDQTTNGLSAGDWIACDVDKRGFIAARTDSVFIKHLEVTSPAQWTNLVTMLSFGGNGNDIRNCSIAHLGQFNGNDVWLYAYCGHNSFLYVGTNNGTQLTQVTINQTSVLRNWNSISLYADLTNITVAVDTTFETVAETYLYSDGNDGNITGGTWYSSLNTGIQAVDVAAVRNGAYGLVVDGTGENSASVFRINISPQNVLVFTMGEFPNLSNPTGWRAIGASGENVIVSSANTVYSQTAFSEWFGPLLSQPSSLHPSVQLLSGNTFTYVNGAVTITITNTAQVDIFLFSKNTSSSQVYITFAYSIDIAENPPDMLRTVIPRQSYNTLDGPGTIIERVPAGHFLQLQFPRDSRQRTITLHNFSTVPACFLGSVRLLTSKNEYVRIDQLVPGDILRTPTGTTTVREVITRQRTGSTHPLAQCKHIPKDYFGKDLPTSDLFISGGHSIFLPAHIAKDFEDVIEKSRAYTDNRPVPLLAFSRVLPCMLADCENVEDFRTWYHVRTDDDDDCVIAEGVFAETLRE